MIDPVRYRLPDFPNDCDLWNMGITREEWEDTE